MLRGRAMTVLAARRENRRATWECMAVLGSAWKKIGLGGDYILER
jgi:hypothetical protein